MARVHDGHERIIEEALKRTYMFRSLRYIFTGPLLEARIQELAENLAKEQRKREADNHAWEQKYATMRRDSDAEKKTLSDRLLYMAGVPVEALPSTPDTTNWVDATEAQRPIRPGEQSLAIDTQLEAMDHEALMRYWQEGQAAIAADID